MRIASTTKIMTALVAIESGGLSRTVTIRRSETEVEGTSMYLRQGEKLTLETLLYGLLLCSGNDAALAIADAVGGSRENFVEMMNARAARLGMDGTSFANPNGLDAEEHYSTAMDMGKLACAAAENETLMRIASTKSVTIGERTMTNHNRLLSMMDGCIGLKTGYTRAAGRTLVSCAVRNGQRLVAVTLQDGNDWADHESLYEYGFAAFPAKTAVTMGETLCTFSTENGGEIPVVAADSFLWPTAEGETLTVEPEPSDRPTVPAGAGTAAGTAYVFLNGKKIGSVPMVLGKAILPALPSPVQLLRTQKGTFIQK